MRPSKFVPSVALALLLIGPAGCKKSPTETKAPTPAAGISAAFSPATAGADTVVNFVVSVSANSKEIRAFGGEVSFDTAMFAYNNEVAKGSLTGSWALVDGNESGGTVRLGGSVGGGTAVPANSSGSIFEVRLKVTGGSYGNGQKVRVCLTQFTDDLAQFGSGEACAEFTLKK